MNYRSIYRPGLFAGQVIAITGGGSGIGRCTAHELASLGASLALIGRNADKLQAVAGEIGQPDRVSTHACDIRDEEAVRGTVAAIVARHGRIDGLFNNAGGQYRSPLHEISTKGFEAVVRSNLVGGFIVMRETFRRWMRERGGAIVNMVADVEHGMPNYGHSGAARGGMITLTGTAASEWAACGVRVNAVAPGFIASSGLDRYSPEHAAPIPDLVRQVPLQRFGTEAEVAAVVVFLLSPAAAYVTGSVYRVDGGSPNARQTATLQPPLRGAAFEGFHQARLPELLSARR